jgi:serine/threonine-protein kinase
MSREPDFPPKTDVPPCNATAALSHLSPGTQSPEILAESSHEFDTVDANGRYQFQKEIARGGMGVVIQAHDRLLERDVAIKLLLNLHASRAHLRYRFVHEALLTSWLQHPCVVPIYDRGQTADGRPFFVMKLISGKTLSSILSEGKKDQLGRSKLLKVFEQVCLAIAYAHSQRILHLDLKPSNVMVGQFGEVHLVDWGMARLTTELDYGVSLVSQSNDAAPFSMAREVGTFAWDQQIHSTDQTCSVPLGVGGTLAYMSPEQANGGTVDTHTDIFGLGGILCEILTGSPPYRGNNSRRLYARAVNANLGDAMKRLDHCNRDPRLVEIARRCLSAAPDHRPVDARTVAGVIGNYLESAVEQAESDLCRFFDLTLDLFCIATLDGYFTRVNCNFPKVLGYCEHDLVSQPFMCFVHPDDVKGTEEVVVDLVAGKPVVQFCNRYRHADGHYVTLEWTAQSIPDEGTIFAVARDVTARSGIPIAG